MFFFPFFFFLVLKGFRWLTSYTTKTIGIFFLVNILATRGLSLRKHPKRETSPAAKSEEKRMISQAIVDFVCLFFSLTPTPFPVARSAFSNIPSGLHSDKVQWLVLFLAKYYAHMATFW